MKLYFLLVLMLVCTCSFAQKPHLTDKLNPDKQIILEKHVAYYNGKMLFSNYHMDPKDFIPKVEAFKTEAYSQIKHGNAKKIALQKQDIDYFARGILYKYKGNYGLDSTLMANFKKLADEKGKTDPMAVIMKMTWVLPQTQLTKQQKDHLDSLINTNTDLNNEDLFKQSASYRQFVGRSIETLWQGPKYTKDSIIYKKDIGFRVENGAKVISVIENGIENPFIKEWECYDQTALNIKLLKKAGDIDRAYQDFMSEAKNPYYIKEIQSQYDDRKRMDSDKLNTADFTYNNVDDKPITLSSLRGKYVYIDVWATWCGPCKQEIPFLKTIEEAYKDKNITFVSLSVDYAKDRAKWQQMVKDMQLTGIQVMADKDFGSDYIKTFGIISIPRFILIAPDGKIVSDDAKRPSNPELKKQFDELLK